MIFPKILITIIPIIKSPGTLRKNKIKVNIIPNKDRITSGANKLPIASKDRLPPDLTMPAFSNPKTTRNIPIPAVIPIFKFCGIFCAKYSLIGVNAITMYKKLLIIEIAIACSQVKSIPTTKV